MSKLDKCKLVKGESDWQDKVNYLVDNLSTTVDALSKPEITYSTDAPVSTDRRVINAWVNVDGKAKQII